MRHRQVATAALVMALGWTAAAAAQQTPETLYQAALYQEEVRGDLQQAVTLYQRILTTYPANRAVGAKAQLHIGLCYENLGLAEAQRAYQQVISNYGDQADVVRQARAHLAALRPAAAAGKGPVARRVLDADPVDYVEMSPAFDGRRVAYVSMSDGGVYVRDLGTGDVQALVTGTPAVWHYFPKWSPDGRRLAVGTTDQATGVTVIELIDVATRAVEAVPGTRTQGQHGIVPAEWSRDGRSLLCMREGRLVLLALGEVTLTTLADSVRPDKGSLSPDGRFVVYAVGSDRASRLFIKPVAGGAPRPITAPEGSAGNPVWSPDGRAIAYEYGDGIWVVPVSEGAASGAPRQAVVTGSISLRGWTEGGLYYVAWGTLGQVPYQIRMNPATGEAAGDLPERLSARPPDGWLGMFAWSPDMRRVAFVHWHPAAVSIYSADRGTVERFDLGGQGYAQLPSWSADGREVLVHVITPQVPGTDTIRAVDPATGRVRDLEPQIPHGFAASYSADGRTVAYSRQDPSMYTSWRVGEVVVAPAGAGDGQVVARTGGDGEPAIINPWPRLSPRGDKVMYVRQDRQSEPPGPATLWVVGSDGRGARRMATAASFTSMVWDASGRFVAYTAMESTADSAPTLHVVDAATGADRRIALPTTFPRNVTVSDWTRDGSLLGLVARMRARSNEWWVAQGLEEGGR
jgi:Tol biopolymer transport system component